MNGFVSYRSEFEMLLKSVLVSKERHLKWLNTLSYLENVGARKIARFEHPTLVKKETLKHAAEEFRHAHLLKKQMERLSSSPPANYEREALMGGFATLHYLHRLDLEIARFLQKEIGYTLSQSLPISYLLVTYAIELRALELYSVYDELLRSCKSPIAIRSIFLEEKHHLEEMRSSLQNVKDGEALCSRALYFESRLCYSWLKALLV